MSPLVDLFGEHLNKKRGSKVVKILTADLQKEEIVIGIYFSAHYCPPCRVFTPELIEFYNKFTTSNPGILEIVFVSCDKSEEDFNSYYSEMPWCALPYPARTLQEIISEKYKVKVIPTFILLDAMTLEVLCKSGHDKVTMDKEGTRFPWRPPSLQSLFQGQLVSKSGLVDTATALQGKLRGLYFSANWDPKCHIFTPKLIETYKKLQDSGKNFEIVFVSWDKSKDEFEEHYKDMPWLAVPKEEQYRIDSLFEHFEVKGVPVLVILDEHNELITTWGRAAVCRDPDGTQFPWYPKPVEELSGDIAETLTESASLIYITGGNKDEINKAQVVMMPIAESYIAEFKSKCGDMPALAFFYEGPNQDLITYMKSSFGYGHLRAPALLLIDMTEQNKYRRNSASKESIQEVVDAFKAGTLAVEDLIEEPEAVWWSCCARCLSKP